MKKTAQVMALLLLSTVARAATTINMAVRHGELRYDVEEIQVAPGEMINLVFHNNDEMQHNIVICAIGTDTNAVGLAAIALGIEEGMKKQFIPESKDILFHSPLVDAGATYTLSFTAPKKTGTYPYVCTFPGHYNVMKGKLIVAKGGGPLLRNLTWDLYEGSFSTLPDFGQLKSVASGAIADGKVSLSPAGARTKDFALRFKATMNLAEKGAYSFALGGDDGVRLLIDGKKVVEHDGIHPVVRQTGKIDLDAGAHDLELTYFQDKGGMELALSVSGPMLKETPLSATKLGGGAAPAAAGLPIPVTDKMVVYRSGLNYEGKIPYAITVGFPGDVSAAFDADRCLLAVAWTGGYVDAKADWTGRGGNGTGVIGQPFANLKSDAAVSAKPLFSAYRVHKDSIEFLWQVEALTISQKLTTMADGKGLRMLFAVSGTGAPVTVPLPANATINGAAAAAVTLTSGTTSTVELAGTAK